MARLRSPNCPSITLAEAIQKARKVYDQEHTHPADRKVIAEDLGYSGISGPSATLIGALRQYGLLEGSGEALRISPDAVTVFELPQESQEYREAIQRMAFAPALFEELRTQFGENPPGEANLRHLLIKKGFLPKTADDVIKAYRENLSLAGGMGMEYNEPKELPMETTQERRQPVLRSDPVHFSPAASGSTGSSISTPVGKTVDGRAVFAHVHFDAELQKEFVSGLKKYLDYLETTLQ